MEGFEIAVLRGAKHSLFCPGVIVRALVAEVGPDRWERTGVDLAVGAGKMAEHATHFRQSFVLLRGDKHCPVKSKEWSNLMQKMEAGGWHCNFFYQN